LSALKPDDILFFTDDIKPLPVHVIGDLDFARVPIFHATNWRRNEKL